MRLSRRSCLLGSAVAPLTSCRSSDGRESAAFWFSYGGKNREVLERMVARFHVEQSQTGIRATFQGDYYESLAKLRTALSAGVAPAMSHVVAEVIPYLAEAGVLEPLDGYEGASELGVLPALGQSLSWEGGAQKPLVALPFNRSIPIMYLNMDLLAKAGVAPPTTWDNLRQAARALTDRRGDTIAVWGFTCPVSWWFWVALVGAAGGSLVNAQGEVTLGGEAGVRALDFWQTMVHRDRVMRPPLGRDYNAWQAAMQDFLAGRAAILWSSTAFMRYVEENARFSMKVMPLPGDARSAIPTGGTFFVLLKDAPQREKDAAWRFLRWMEAPRQTIEWAVSTGYLPVTRGAVERLSAEGYYQKHAGDRVALEQLAAVQPWPWSPTLFRVQREIVDPLLEDAVADGRSARVAMAEARRLAQEP